MSGQLNGETYASALSDVSFHLPDLFQNVSHAVFDSCNQSSRFLTFISFLQIYTFGPTFRAENSNTSRHLTEFWVFEHSFTFIFLRILHLITLKFSFVVLFSGVR